MKMATPPRLVKLECPRCHTDHWEIDHDYRGDGSDQELSYEDRAYRCPICGTTGRGYAVTEKSPPEFFLQPRPLYPMSIREFDRWVAVLRQNFPDHPHLRDLGTRRYTSGT